MSQQPHIHHEALTDLRVYLPLDLTRKQLAKVLEAAAHVYQRGFKDGASHQAERFLFERMAAKAEEPTDE